MKKVNFIYCSNFLSTVFPACAACYGIKDSKYPKDKDKLDYIGRRVKSGHTSILEHSNVIIEIEYDLSDYFEVAGYLDNTRYLSCKTKELDDEKYVTRISGSIRGFRYAFSKTYNTGNRLNLEIMKVLKENLPPEVFLDFIVKKNIIKDYEFNKEFNTSFKPIVTDKLEILNIDKFKNLTNNSAFKDSFNAIDFGDDISITVVFKNMSRVITQQLTRHRNGITQESQRYVNYSKAGFNCPTKFNKDYDENKKYNISAFNEDLTLKELGDKLMSIYPDLVKQGIIKEDARGYLPQNVQCGKVFMTFNMRTLMKFFKLRLDPHAQTEIREYAEELESIISNYYDLNRRINHD